MGAPSCARPTRRGPTGSRCRSHDAAHPSQSYCQGPNHSRLMGGAPLVDVRNSRLGLVGRVPAGGRINVEPGIYVASVVFPTGQRLSAPVSIDEGEESNVVLETPPETRRVDFQEPWGVRHRPAYRTVRSFPPRDPRATVREIAPDALQFGTEPRAWTQFDDLDTRAWSLRILSAHTGRRASEWHVADPVAPRAHADWRWPPEQPDPEQRHTGLTMHVSPRTHDAVLAQVATKDSPIGTRSFRSHRTRGGEDAICGFDLMKTVFVLRRRSPAVHRSSSSRITCVRDIFARPQNSRRMPKTCCKTR